MKPDGYLTLITLAKALLKAREDFISCLQEKRNEKAVNMHLWQVLILAKMWPIKEKENRQLLNCGLIISPIAIAERNRRYGSLININSSAED